MKNIVSALVLLLGFARSGIAQVTPWNNNAQWTIYQIVDRRAIRATMDSLVRYPKQTLSKDTVLYYLGDATRLTDSTAPVWMGAYTLTYEQKGTTPQKLLVSSYGGFVFDAASKSYYQIQEDKRQPWLEWIGHQYSRIPAR